MFEAVRYEAGFAVSVFEWIMERMSAVPDETVSLQADTVRISTPRSKMVLRPGDWVVRFAWGFCVMSDEQYNVLCASK